MTSVILPPQGGVVSADGMAPGGWWHTAEDGERIVCDLCPRECHLKPGDRGFCFVRQNVAGQMMLTTYGRSTGFCIDPIEKKPLNHFLPGTSVLSFGTAGCNLGCKFCQNWDISKSREVARLSELAWPEAIAEAARQHGCQSVAYTYNDPVVWAEYAIDTARACRAVGIKNVAVTAGYISPAARGPFYQYMDAANVDLKAFSEEFYYKITYSHLQPVLDTLEWLKRETNVWFEITNLVIPRTNDSLAEIGQMCDWILDRLGPDVPLHFTAFHPDFRMLDLPPTPRETLLAARAEALRRGVHYCYVGNVDDTVHQSTYCPACGGLLIERNWYELGRYHLVGDRCGHCQAQIAGVFAKAPGKWGRKRLPIQMSRFAQPLVSLSTSKSKESQMASAPEQPQPTSFLSTQAGLASPRLTADQQQQIHAAANEIVQAAVLERSPNLPDPQLGGAGQIPVEGAFVTLKRHGALRACCGTVGATMPLATALQEAAYKTATGDVRLPTISPTELAYLELDVSLLHSFRELPKLSSMRLSDVEIGRHGLQIRRGNQGGLLLPNVATEQGYTALQFLQQVCRKAGLPSNAWEDPETQLMTFETFMIEGPVTGTGLPTNVPPLLTNTELQTLSQHVGNTILAFLQGATPSYYLPNCADGNVNTLAITLQPEGGEAVNLFRVALRPGLPLQATLFAMSGAIADGIREGRIVLPSVNVAVGVTFLFDPAMHGSVAEPDLDGFDPRQRALLIAEGDRYAFAFDPAKTPAELFEVVNRLAAIQDPSRAGLFGMACQSSATSISMGNAPRAATGQAVRPPAVAGSFYPREAAQVQSLLDKFLSTPAQPRLDCSAILVPHAGWVYSGRIAGEVFSQVEIPDTVIVIGPKHTAAGLNWSVAPHQTWSFPGGEVAADQELAQALVEAIPGLQFDAAAHRAEHAIEVELPFLARRNPQVKVVGIAIGSASLEQCQTFATGLAKVLQSYPRKVLLVISSDMNHYARDDENRRLDEIAMQALERLAPDELYHTVVGQGISMCGVLPAVIALEAIRQNGQLHRSQRIGYTTSAETSGDTSRVVGYCGMVFH